FRKNVAGLLDVDEFLRFLAATVLMSSWDSFLRMGHNYFLYLNPETDRFVFIPWDEDLTFGGGPGGPGGGSSATELSLMKPYGGRHRLVERLLAVPEYAAAYQEHCRKLMRAMPERFAEEIPQVERAIADAKQREAAAVAARQEGPRGGPGFGGP